MGNSFWYSYSSGEKHELYVILCILFNQHVTYFCPKIDHNLKGNPRKMVQQDLWRPYVVHSNSFNY